MLFGHEKLHICYNDIRDAAQEAGSNSCTVLLLVAMDVDAICAARILSVRSLRYIIYFLFLIYTIL